MGEYLDKVPEEIHDHIRQITSTSGLPDTEESVEAIAKAWLEKQRIFEQKLSEMEMEEAEDFSADEERGALLLTYSGSIITVGPLVEDRRRAEYASIGLRQDVPASAVEDESMLAEDIEIDEPVAFKRGPIRKSSPIYKIAVYKEELDPEEEEKKLAEATQILTEEFVEVNKTIVLE